EPPADMSWELFISIVDQIPNLQRAVLHGVGEPLLVRNLPRMVRYLKDRGTYVLFNTNGTLLNERNGRALIEAGLDELRVSLDASNAKSFLAIRGKDYFGRILRNVRAFRNLQEREGTDRPRVSAWLTGLKETIAELPAFVQVAAEIGVREVYLQRLVFFENDSIGQAARRLCQLRPALEPLNDGCGSRDWCWARSRCGSHRRRDTDARRGAVDRGGGAEYPACHRIPRHRGRWRQLRRHCCAG